MSFGLYERPAQLGPCQGDPEQPVKAESPHPTPLQSSAPEFRSVPLRPPGAAVLGHVGMESFHREPCSS